MIFWWKTRLLSENSLDPQLYCSLKISVFLQNNCVLLLKTYFEMSSQTNTWFHSHSSPQKKNNKQIQHPRAGAQTLNQIPKGGEGIRSQIENRVHHDCVYRAKLDYQCVPWPNMCNSYFPNAITVTITVNPWISTLANTHQWMHAVGTLKRSRHPHPEGSPFINSKVEYLSRADHVKTIM